MSLKPAILALLIILAACAPKTSEPPATGGGQQEPSCICIALYDPVCGSDGKTYSNNCYAACAKVNYTAGECA